MDKGEVIVHFQFLIEDISGEIFIRHVVEKLMMQYDHISYDCKAFKGIGGLKISGNANKVKTDKLLDDLLIFLRGFDKSLKGIPAAIVVVLDNDKRDTNEFRLQLETQAQLSMISIDYVFCIAVEEMEAWLLGDREALQKAYPEIRLAFLKDYVQDEICGTWELLANALYKGGLKQFKKDNPTYREVGKCKSEWAREVGRYIDLDKNLSPSFQEFISSLKKRLNAA